jgi:hypothetical protein
MNTRLVDNHDLQNYLTKNIEEIFQKCIFRIRMSLQMLKKLKGLDIFKIHQCKRVCRISFTCILVCPYCDLRNVLLEKDKCV